jgi:probable F420-dependent oxidoreductase
MLVSVGLPTHRVDAPDEFLTGEAIGELAVAAERAGFGAVFVTDHPFPGDEWLAKGGHHAVDPFLALAFAAAATTKLRLHTNLFVAAYRQPYLAAHQVATLDRLSGGRVILGVGAGYLQPEFDALDADFEHRNDRTDDAIRAMRRAWTGESVDGNTMAPTPIQPGGPPIWIGGNSKRAIRRAVELGDGWSPFPNHPKMAAITRTPALWSADDLRASLAYAGEHASTVGRTTPLDVVFSAGGGSMTNHRKGSDTDQLLEQVADLRAAGMTAMTTMVPGQTRAEVLDGLARFGDEVLSRLPD